MQKMLAKAFKADEKNAGGRAEQTAGAHTYYSLLHAHDLPGKVAISIDEHARQRRLGIIRNAVVEHDAHKLCRRELGRQLTNTACGGNGSRVQREQGAALKHLQLLGNFEARLEHVDDDGMGSRRLRYLAHELRRVYVEDGAKALGFLLLP